MLAYCGINCSECKAYKGTVNGDETLLEKMAEGGPDKPEDWVCLGCGAHNNDIVAKYCTGCGIRLCATERGVSNCSACDQFETCDKVQPFINGEGRTLVRKMGLLRQRYLAGLEEEAARAGS